MLRFFSCSIFLSLLLWQSLPAQAAPAFADTLAQRTLACTGCHGKEGRAGPDGYYPRLAGKPAGYLYNQLLNFRDGRRHYGLMASLVEPLSDAYLMEIAQYFSQLELPYPAPPPATASQNILALGKKLVSEGDKTRNIPACTQCHGPSLTGVAPHVPGLLGLSGDYVNAQLGGWQTSQRRAQAPDCMAQIAGRLSPQDVNAISQWLASQPLPANTKPLLKPTPLAPGAHPIDCGNTSATQFAPVLAVPANKTDNAQVTRGAYLARAGNCMACHTPQGGAEYAGGRPIKTPFGTVYSSNLTADAVAGLGQWSSNDFWQAMHHGRSKNGRLLNPAFPYTNFTQVTRADSDALFAFFKTVAPSSQTNREHAMRWPFGTQAALAAWRSLYFTPGTYSQDATQTAEWNRGAYLVRGLGHCSACHTPRNSLGAERTDLPADLSGSMISQQNWYASSLRFPLGKNESNQHAKNIKALLQTGIHQTGAALGPMSEVVRGSTQHLSDGDLNAMVAFLKSLPPKSQTEAKPTRTPAGSSSAEQDSGAKLYEKHCVQCHGAQGEGVAGAYPALAHNRNTTQASPANLVQIVLYGGFAPATHQNPRPFGMPPFVLQMNDKETASVLNYIRRSWGNQAPVVTELEVNQVRERP
jgi:cytochrome c553